MLIDTLEPRRLFAATLTAGVSVTTGIKAAGVQKNWSIHLNAGQTFVVAAGDNSSSFTTELVFISPTGKALRRSSGASGAFIGAVAPVTGTYRVRARDVTNSHTASVTLTSFFASSGTVVADGDDAMTASSGRRYAASISPGDLDVWAVPATKGAFINIVDNENANGSSIGVGVLLVAPDGTPVTSKENDQGVDISTTAKQTGTYYAVAYEPGQDAGGRYGFSTGIAPGAQTTEDPDTQTPLGVGTTRTGNLPSGDQDVFSLTLGKGTAATFKAKRTGSTTTPNMILIDPNGNVVANAGNTAGSGSTFTVTATVGGTYELILVNGETDTGGAYSVSYAAG